jgi:hypothetical protein
MGETEISWTHRPGTVGRTWNQKLLLRFWSNVEKTADCWRWTGGVFSNGYGQFRLGRKKARAHRAAYELLVGNIPKDKIVCHRCDNPVCVNPEHLFLGTHADNARDRDEKGRGGFVQPAPMPGEKNPSARLTAEDVLAIRAAWPRTTQAVLAKQYGVAPTTISAVVRRETWSSL